MSQKQLGRRFSHVDLEEFRALVKNLIPTTVEQAEWISNEAKRILHGHPELKEKIEEWEEGSEEEREEAERIFTSILKHVHSERGRGKKNKSCRKRVKK